MTSSRPYLIRAIYEWITDNQLTPYIVINAQMPGTLVPEEYVKEGRIVLNIAPTIVHGLLLGNEYIEFKARFGGVPRQIHATIPSIIAIYAKENGRGMVFNETDEDNDIPPTTSPTGTLSNMGKRSKPNLKIVK